MYLQQDKEKDKDSHSTQRVLGNLGQNCYTGFGSTSVQVNLR